MAAVDADYLVIGAGASGLAFTDALIDHSDVRVALVDRRRCAGGHWLDAYPFVRLHQASSFYGVASTVLGDGSVQRDGPEKGLHERATGEDVRAYYRQVLDERLLASGRVEFHRDCEYLGAGAFVSLQSGERHQAGDRCRIVDARYLSPQIPATTPPPFAVAGGMPVLPVNELPRIEHAPAEYVIVGSGKTATDACVWLLSNGVDPDSIRWIRPREPWMLNRAVVQPNPAIFIGMAADIMEAATRAASPDDLFLRMEEAGVMLRIDRSVTPTMAKTPTLARWELDLLRSIERVTRLGHICGIAPGRIELNGGQVAIRRDALIVHCAAPGLRYPPLIPIWGPEAITIQPVRAGFPCFAAALIGYVEATRDDDDDDKNRLCPPSPLSDTPADWALMQVLGGRATLAFNAEPDIKAWSDGVALNPARVPPDTQGMRMWQAQERASGRRLRAGSQACNDWPAPLHLQRDRRTLTRCHLETFPARSRALTQAGVRAERTSATFLYFCQESGAEREAAAWTVATPDRSSLAVTATRNSLVRFAVDAARVVSAAVEITGGFMSRTMSSEKVLVSSIPGPLNRT